MYEPGSVDFEPGTVEYEPGVAEWPGAATSSDAAATPQYRPYQPEALAGARVWYSTAAATDMNDDQGAAAAQTAEAGAAGSAAAGAPLAFRQQGPAADAEPNLIDLAAADELPATHIAAPAAAITHDSRYARGTGAAVPPSATAASREPPDLYVCPITQELMAEPVTLSDGFNYDRAALEMWLLGHDTSPMTGAQLEANSRPLPNFALRSAIGDWRQQGTAAL